MKKIFLTSLAFLIVVLGISQTQKLKTPRYHKVKMEGGNGLAIQLLKLGITIDHSIAKDNSITSEISDEEIAILKQNNIKYTVLIEDMAKFYQDRNKADFLDKTMAVGLCNDPKVVKPTKFHLGSMGGFFTLVEMQNIIDSMTLLYPSLITAKAPISNTLTIEGRTIWYLKISDNPNVNEPEPQVLYDAIHHAREPQSMSQLIFYMWYLLENYATNPDVKFLVDNTEMYFIPCVNPDGYVYNQTTNPGGGGMWRKNRRVNGGGTFGVDLNRNYGYNWGYDNVGSSPTTSSDTYRGTAQFSEPETQGMRAFCMSHQFKVALNAHTYSNLLIYPWGYLPSYYTPDSATFVNWATYLTEDSRFLYGTGDQTVNYVTNGDSDDWMYGDQVSKPKIMAMTPEAGSANDGFWPASNRILDICKTTFNQNLYHAKLVTNFAVARDAQDRFFFAPSGYIKYNLLRMGLQAGSFTVSIVPVGTGIATTGAAKVYPSMTLNQLINDSISFTLSGGLTAAQPIKYLIGVNNGLYTHYDTISKIYGNTVTLLNDACSNMTNWNAGGWSNSTTKFKSAPGSITDSPLGNYGNNQNKNVSLLSSLNLTGAVYAHLQYWTRFETEKNFDYAQILASTNAGVSWSPLCGRYETAPASFGGTNPLYDGLQDGWVKEEIDLSSYLGSNLLLRFNLTTDPGATKDGFYFDDILVRKILTVAAGVTQINVSDNISMYPNPSIGRISFKNEGGQDLDVKIFNSLGQEVMNGLNVKAFEAQKEFNIEGLSNGLYYVEIKASGDKFIQKLILNK